MPVSACGPWQLPSGKADEDFDEVKDDPGDDHVVVQPDANHDQKHRISNPWRKATGEIIIKSNFIFPEKTRTLEEWNDPPERDGAAAGVLAEGELEEEEGKASEGQVGEVGDEEGA